MPEHAFTSLKANIYSAKSMIFRFLFLKDFFVLVESLQWQASAIYENVSSINTQENRIEQQA